MLIVDSVTVGGAGTPKLRSVSLRVAPPRIIALVGPNGAGKTTLARAIAGLIPVQTGEIRWTFGAETIWRSGDPAWQRAGHGIAYIPAEGHVFESLSVIDNIRLAMPSMPGYRSRTMLNSALAEFPLLEPLLGQRAVTLSGGERRVLSIARGVLALEANPHPPRLMILDEPTRGLHKDTAHAIGVILAAIQTKGIGVLLIEQSVSFALALADYAYVMQRGAVTWHGHRRDALQVDFAGLFLGTSPAVPGTTDARVQAARELPESVAP